MTFSTVPAKGSTTRTPESDDNRPMSYLADLALAARRLEAETALESPMLLERALNSNRTRCKRALIRTADSRVATAPTLSGFSSHIRQIKLCRLEYAGNLGGSTSPSRSLVSGKTFARFYPMALHPQENA